MACRLFLAVGALDRELADAVRTVPVCVHGSGQDADNERHAQVVRSELHDATHRSSAVHPARTT